MYLIYWRSIKNYILKTKNQVSSEVFLISGDTNYTYSEATQIGIIFKIKGVLKDLQQKIAEKFDKSEQDVQMLKGLQKDLDSKFNNFEEEVNNLSNDLIRSEDKLEETQMLVKESMSKTSMIDQNFKDLKSEISELMKELRN